MNKKKDILNDSKSSKPGTPKENKFMNLFKEGIKKDLIKFDIKIELDQEPENYDFKPYFVKNENYSSDSNKNSKENLNMQSTHKK